MLKFGTTNIEISSSQTSRDIIGGAMRDSMVFVTQNADYATVNSCFSGGAEYCDEITVDGNTVSTDLSNYCVAGHITDNRDGTFTIIMGKKTEYELTIEQLEADNAALLFENLTGGDFNE